MKKELGLWIDHREAVIVTVAPKGSTTGEAINHIYAAPAEEGRFSANAPDGSPEDRRDRRLGEHLHHYYSEVIGAIRAADSILIFGPGEAKGELKKQLEHERLGGRIVEVETADKLTEPQIVAKVRHYFLK